jgi:hypothetical protein
MARLHALDGRPGLSQVQDVLAVNPQMDVDKSTWKYVGFKGGSEPGVLAGAWLLERADGRWFVVSVIADDPASATDHTLAAEVLGGTAMTLLVPAP